jgi:hypothetical protein
MNYRKATRGAQSPRSAGVRCYLNAKRQCRQRPPRRGFHGALAARRRLEQREVRNSEVGHDSAHRTTGKPLERAEIDHTRMNLFVVADDTCRPVGRPWLSVCLDDRTSTVLGLYISVDPPAISQLRATLRRSSRSGRRF